MINERPIDDPKLQATLNEVRAVMERYDFAGAVMLVAEKEAAFTYKMDAPWSALRKDHATPLGFRFRAISRDTGKRETERRVMGGMHTVCQLSDFGAQTMDWMEQLKALLRKAGIDFEHTPFNGRPIPSLGLGP